MTQQGPIIFNGRYELHRRLGRGGMAEVYLARDQMLDRPVAVKVLFPALATDPGFVERFRREAQSAAALNHPNIVGVYDWGEANGTYFIVMEYVEGESLAELIHAEGRLHPDRAAEVAADIASALGFAHRNGGVIHRDVKPGNVLITREGDVKVADFGIARAISDSSEQNLTKTGSVMGTATYFSPEQARGAGIDPRSDVYSLGCVLYEMIIGRPPFEGENAVAIAYKHVQEQAPPPRQVDPAIPDTLEAIVLKCLAKNPENRYPSAQDMRADLRRYLDGARIMAEPVMAAPEPGATGVMAPTGYMQPTSAMGDPWAGTPYDDGYRDGYDDLDEMEERRSKAPLVILVLLLLLLAGLLLWWALSSRDGGTAEPTRVEVVDLVGMTRQEAEETLADDGLDSRVQGITDQSQVDAGTEVGTVVGHDPPAGEQVDEGSTVTLRVWQGADTVTVPEVDGRPQEEAEQLLEDAELRSSIEVEESEEVDEGNVIRSDPAQGDEAPVDSLVVLTVSSGTDTVQVPGNLVGMSEGDARSAIEGADLSVGQSTRQSHPDVEAGNVISSDPAPGSEVQPGSTVNLVVSEGPGDITVEDVEGTQQEAAVSIINNQGLSPDVQPTSTDDPNEDGVVTRQSPGPGTTVEPGSSVVLIVGQYRPPETSPTTASTTTTTGDGGGPPDLLR